jgi:hypothetical protein
MWQGELDESDVELVPKGESPILVSRIQIIPGATEPVWITQKSAGDYFLDGVEGLARGLNRFANPFWDHSTPRTPRGSQVQYRGRTSPPSVWVRAKQGSPAHAWLVDRAEQAEGHALDAFPDHDYKFDCQLRTARQPILKGCFVLDWTSERDEGFFVLCVDQIE